MTFDTHLLDAAIARQRARREQDRQQLLAEVMRLLDELGPRHGISQAYIFGSLVRPGSFHEQSDVDIAVEEIAAADFFDFMSAFSMALEREVDLLELHKCHFAHRIRSDGIKWTKN